MRLPLAHMVFGAVVAPIHSEDSPASPVCMALDAGCCKRVRMHMQIELRPPSGRPEDPKGWWCGVVFSHCGSAVSFGGGAAGLAACSPSGLGACSPSGMAPWSWSISGRPYSSLCSTCGNAQRTQSIG